MAEVENAVIRAFREVFPQARAYPQANLLKISPLPTGISLPRPC